jgi:hypothetical protein
MIRMSRQAFRIGMVRAGANRIDSRARRDERNDNRVRTHLNSVQP